MRTPGDRKETLCKNNGWIIFSFNLLHLAHKIIKIFLEWKISNQIIKKGGNMDMNKKEIKKGANGAYVDDGENLRKVDQRGNGSEKPKPTSAVIRQLAPLGD